MPNAASPVWTAALAGSLILVLAPWPAGADLLDSWASASTDTLSGTWSQLEFADPEPRDSPSMIFDPVRNRIITCLRFFGLRHGA